jgi:predicted RNase H-like HicB family nuclease
MTKRFKIIIERHPDGYVAYPVGFKGIITGRGNSKDEALEEVKAAIIYRITTFGEEVLELDSPVLDAFIADAGVTV